MRRHDPSRQHALKSSGSNRRGSYGIWWISLGFVTGGALTLAALFVLASSVVPLFVTPIQASIDPMERTAVPGFARETQPRIMKGARLTVAPIEWQQTAEVMDRAFQLVAPGKQIDVTDEYLKKRIEAAHGGFDQTATLIGGYSPFELATLVAGLPKADMAADIEIAALSPDDIPTPTARPAVPRRGPTGPNPLLVRKKAPSAYMMGYADAGASEPDEDTQRITPSYGTPRQLSKHKWPGKGSRVAVYDVSAGLVYMPNGEKLEAHSGIGHMRDNPRYSHVRMRGPTPPSVYNLRMRESRFHGVEAIRLLPADGVNPLGRNGLLAHTYMLRKPGDSNGCVVFADYKRFLTAFKAGHVKRMVVVSKLPENRTQIAELFP